jgi:TolB-like protein/Tfp pilus assembly protein PilF
MAEPISSDVAGRPRSAPASSDPADPGLPLSETEFADAVRSALRHYLRTDLLRENPLLCSRLVAAAVRDAETPIAPVQALKDLLRTHCERIGDAPKLEALRRVLELTWLAPMRSQQVVAESLHLSWSTYRRRLSDAMQLLAAQLWEAECALARPAASGARPPGRTQSLLAAAGPSADEPAPVSEADTPADTRPSSSVAAPARRHRGWFVAAAVVMAGVAIVAAVIGGPHRGAARVQTPAAAVPPGSAPATAPVTLAVLPFLDMDADPGQQYLSDGITEELINRLGRFPRLRVAARTSTFVFRDKPVDVRQAARALGVANVLEGSVQHSGERLRVRVALVSAQDGYELWASEYEPAASDLLTVEDEIAEAVIRELQPKLSTEVLSVLHVRAGLDPAAHDYYLVGLQYLNRRTSPDIEQAIVYFRRAIQADPGYAPAWSAVAEAYTVLRDYNSDAPPDAHYEEALNAARRAAALDAKLSRPHAVLGLLYEEHWQWARAGDEFKLALQLDPSDAAAHQWYAMYLWFVDDPQGGLAEMRTARDLDPLSPIINTDYGRALIYTGDVEGAIAQYRTTIAMEPRFALAHLFLSAAWMGKNRYQDALGEARTAVALTPAPHPSSYLSLLGVGQWLVGDHTGARRQQLVLRERASRQYVSGVALGLLSWQLGDRDRALAEFSRAVTDHDHLMISVIAMRDAEWRADPRFAALMAKMELPRR